MIGLSWEFAHVDDISGYISSGNKDETLKESLFGNFTGNFVVLSRIMSFVNRYQPLGIDFDSIEYGLPTCVF